MNPPGAGLNPRDFHQWWQDSLEAGVAPDDVMARIGHATELDVCRQMVVGYIGSVASTGSLIEACRFAKNPQIRVYAEALDCYVLVARAKRRDDSPSAPAVGLLPKLHKLLHESETREQSWFEKEIQAVLHMAISNAYLLKGDPETALGHVSESYYLAQTLKSKVFLERARSMQLSCLAAKGQLSAALALNAEGDTRFAPVASEVHNLRVQAYTLSQLGDVDGALACFEQVGRLRTTRKARLEADLKRIQLLWGVGTEQSEALTASPHSNVVQALFEALSVLLSAYCMPRDRKNASLRNDLLQQAVKTGQGMRHAHVEEWTNFFGRWVQAKAHYLLGETTLAQNGFQDLEPASSEVLDVRLLQAGMALEIALHVNQPFLEVAVWVEKLRNVFRDARKIAYASPEGLARRLMFWHPVVAAFIAMAEDPVEEVATATQTVLRLGAKSYWWGTTNEIPPPLGAELALKSMNLDANPRIRLQQATLGRHRGKRSELEVLALEKGVPNGFISAAPLIFGLVKMGDVGRAHSVYTEFGLSPESRAEYRGLSLIQQIDRYTRMLLEKTMDPVAYSQALSDLESGVNYAP